MKALELRDVWLAFGATRVLEAVDLTLEEGEFLGVIGPNGAGKTVLLKVILGLLRPDRGSVEVLGGEPEQARGDVAYVPQHVGFDASFPIRVREMVLMGRLGADPGARGFSDRDRELAQRAMEELDVVTLADRRVGELSGGQRQRALIARAICARPRLLLLDEPTASLDPRVGAELYERLEGLHERVTVVLVSHDIGVVTRHVTSIACMNRRLHHHPSREITEEMIELAYGCPVDFVVHEHTHRVLQDHPRDDGTR